MDFIKILALYKDQLELIYLVSAPLMLVSVIVAWFQLNAVRKDIKAKYRRESIKEVLYSMGQNITQIENLKCALVDQLHEADIYIDAPKLTDFNYDSFPKECPWLAQLEQATDANNAAIDFLNCIDGCAQLLLSGIADERFAYNADGSYFLRYIEEYRPFIAANRNPGFEDCYSHIIELYEMWQNRKERQIAKMKTREAIRKLLSLPKDKYKKHIS